MSADHSAGVASVVLQNQGVIAATLSQGQTVAAGMAVLASEKRAATPATPVPWLDPEAPAVHPKPPRMAYLHDTRTLINAIWPDAPPNASLDDIAAKARAHREIFETYGELIAKNVIWEVNP